ncbi:MAG: cellulose binding domain-containing protein, partial [Cyanobacteria bacterium J06628_3]
KPQTSNITPVTSTATGLTATTNIYTDWETGFCTSFRITNNSSKTVDNWQLKFKMNQAKINNSWNADFNRRKAQYTVTPFDWGQTIKPNQVREIGFCADKLGSDYSPQQVQLKEIKQQKNNNKIQSLPFSK